MDDGSTDDTQQLLSPFRDKIISSKQENAGIARARNAGYALCSGSFIAFLDSDDLYTPGRLSIQMAAFQADPALECVQGYMEPFVSPELPLEFARRIRGEMGRAIAAPMASTTLIKRSAYERVGYWDETLNVGVDMEWYARMKAAQLNYRMLHDVLLRRRIHRNNTNLRLANQQSERLHVLKNILDRRRALQASADNQQREISQ